MMNQFRLFVLLDDGAGLDLVEQFGGIAGGTGGGEASTRCTRPTSARAPGSSTPGFRPSQTRRSCWPPR